MSKRQLFIKEIMADYRRSIPDESHAAMLEDLHGRLMSVATQAVNKAELQLFGSYVSRFCKPTSDADFSLVYRNFSPWLIGIAKVDIANAKRLARFAKIATEAGFSNPKFIQAKIPVVQCVDPGGGVPCDVSIGNVGGVENSKILGKIRDLHPDVIGAYVHTIKEWGKAREFIAPEKQMFNSFTVTTMAIMVLQELAIVPVFHKTTGECGEVTLADAEEKLDAWTVPDVYARLSKDEDIGEGVFFLLQKFAEYYSKFDFKTGTVSLICPRRIRPIYHEVSSIYLNRHAEIKRAKWVDHHRDHFNEVGAFSEEDLSEAMANEESQRPHASPFVVEDLVNYINSGRRVTAARVPHVHSELQRLYDILHKEDVVTVKELMQPSNKLPRFSNFEGSGVIGKREMSFSK